MNYKQITHTKLNIFQILKLPRKLPLSYITNTELNIIIKNYAEYLNSIQL